MLDSQGRGFIASPAEKDGNSPFAVSFAAAASKMDSEIIPFHLQIHLSIANKKASTARVVVSCLLVALPCCACIAGPLTPIPTPLLASTEPRATATFTFPTLPPTSTLAPLQSPTPTANLPAALDGIIFEDDFNGNRGWELFQTDAGAVSLLMDRLAIAIRIPDKLLFTYNSEIRLTDFYLNIEARSDLCSSGDEYGVLFRLNDALEHYRFVLGCEGGARVTRVLSTEARTLIAPTETDLLIRGPMAINRLSIWAFGDTFRFYINDVEIFSLRDPALPEGRLGLFAQSGESQQLTITFDNLVIQALSPKPLPTLIPTP
jgi:hypothetical protein